MVHVGLLGRLLPGEGKSGVQVDIFNSKVARRVPHAHWEAHGRGSLPLQNLVSDSANPHYVSDPLPRPSWDHRSTGQL